MKQARKRIGLCCLLPPTQPVPTVPERAFQLPAATPENYLPKEITRIKRIKIARNDGKHFVDRYVEKKGNEAVKKIERGARQGRGGIFLRLQRGIWQRRRIFSPPLSHLAVHTDGWSGSKGSELPSREGPRGGFCLTKLSHPPRSLNQQVKINCTSTYPRKAQRKPWMCCGLYCGPRALSENLTHFK